MNIFNILLIIIGIIILIGFFVFLSRLITFEIKCFKDYLNRLEIVKECTNTYYKIKNDFSHLISVGGFVGAGKTSFVVGCSQYETLIHIDQCNEKIRWIQTIIPYVNYLILDELIESLYLESQSPKVVYKKLVRLDYSYEMFSGIYDDYIQRIPLYKLLEIYIEARCSLIRNRYIGSNITIKNVITNNTNFYYDYSSLEIKDEEKQKVYLLPKYFTIIEDEALVSIYKNTNSIKSTSDTGLDLSLRLIRHLSRETCRIYATAQNIERISKIIRELSTQYIMIQGYEIIGQQKTKDRFLKKKEEKLEEKLCGSMALQSEKKKKLFRVHQKRKLLFASCYLRYHVVIYSSLADLGKQLEKCDGRAYEEELTFPLTWVFGCYDTYEFNFLDEYLTNLSNKKDIDISIAKEVLTDQELKNNAESILKKLETAEEKKNNTKLSKVEEKQKGLFSGGKL